MGRGNSSRRWNYCGKWVKWQTSRSWGSIPEWFEWGQTPLHMRLPKLRWFKRYYKLLKDVTPVSLEMIMSDERIADGTEVTKELLVSLWYVKNSRSDVKVLWSSEASKKLSFEEWILFSKSAQNALSQ